MRRGELMILAGIGAALANGACDLDTLPRPPASTAVVWVSPLRRHVNNRTWLQVVPTSALRAFLTEPGEPDAARVLQWLGMRRSARPPARRYKVVVFDVGREQLCRPVLTSAPDVRGVPPCEPDHAGPKGAYGGCGTLTDRATGEPSAPVYSAQWQALARDGFCLLPLERFVAVTAGGASGRP